MTLKYYLIVKKMHLKLIIPKLVFCSNFYSWQDYLRPINELIILNSQTLYENGCVMHFLLRYCWLSKAGTGGLLTLKTSHACHISLHVTVISARKLFINLKSSWNNLGPLGFISNFYSNGEELVIKKASIFLHSRLKQKSFYIVTLQDLWHNPTIIFLSLLTYFPSPFKVIISDLYIVPVFPLLSYKLLEDKDHVFYVLASLWFPKMWFKSSSNKWMLRECV